MTPLVTASAVAFWVLAPVMVLAAAVMVMARRPIHSAVSLALVMICLAVQYAAQDAPFLFVVQIIVYTGAILMLFLFVVMLIGVDTSESPVETIRHQRGPALLFGVGLGALLVLGVGHAMSTPPANLEYANRVEGGNVQGLAGLIFSRYVIAFEAASALLITAALAAMVLAHRERLTPKRTQREFVADRMRRYAEQGEHPGNLPNPGVYARHNGIATPALLPDGSISPLSVSQTLEERGQMMDPQPMVGATQHNHAALVQDRDDPALAPGWNGPSRTAPAAGSVGPRHPELTAAGYTDQLRGDESPGPDAPAPVAQDSTDLPGQASGDRHEGNDGEEQR